MKDGIVIGSAALIACAGGFFLGKASGPQSSQQTTLAWQSPSLLGERNAGSYSGGTFQNAAARAAITYNPEVDLENDLQSILRDSSPVNRFASLTRMLSWLNADNLDEVLQAYEDIPMDSEHLKEYQMLLYAWAKFDKDGALDYIDENAPNEAFMDSLLQPVLSSWASEDPQKALEFYQKYENLIKDDTRRHQLQRSLIAGWSVKDPYGATDYLQTQEPNQNREYLIGELSAHMFKLGTDEARQWAEGLTDPKFKEQAWEELAEDWVTVDPQGLAGWLKQHTYHQYSWEAVEDLGRGWIATDPDAATAWFANLPEGGAKQKGITKMARSWAENDLTSLGEWLNSIPNSSTTDLAVEAYAERLVEQAPQAAVDSALSISNDDRRNDTVLKLTQEWYSNDPDAAVAWAGENNYPLDSMQQTNEVYARINANQLKQIEKRLGQGDLSPDMTVELKRTQEMLIQQAEQLKRPPQLEQAPRG